MLKKEIPEETIIEINQIRKEELEQLKEQLK